MDDCEIPTISEKWTQGARHCTYLIAFVLLIIESIREYITNKLHCGMQKNWEAQGAFITFKHALSHLWPRCRDWLRFKTMYLGEFLTNTVYIAWLGDKFNLPQFKLWYILINRDTSLAPKSSLEEKMTVSAISNDISLYNFRQCSELSPWHRAQAKWGYIPRT